MPSVFPFRLVANLFWGVSLILGVSAVFSYRMAGERARTWQPVEARVTDIRIQSYTIRNRDEDAWRQLSTEYRAEFELSHELGGRRYRQWQPDSFASSRRSLIEARLAENPPGSSRRIYVDPSRPDQFALEIAGVAGLIGPIVCGGLTVIFAIVAWAVGRLLPRLGATVRSEWAADGEFAAVSLEQVMAESRPAAVQDRFRPPVWAKRPLDS